MMYFEPRKKYIVLMKPTSLNDIKKLGLSKHLECYSSQDIKKLFWVVYEDYLPKSISKLPSKVYKTTLKFGEADSMGRWINSNLVSGYRKGKYGYVTNKQFDRRIMNI